MKLALIFLLALIILVLWRPGFNFSAQSPSDYADGEPVFDIRKHLNGKMLCEGIIYGPTGKVVSRFIADMEGEWQEDNGRLRELFRYADGSTQNREWVLSMGQKGAFSATAEDIIGSAQGMQSGNTVRMSYRIRLPEDAGGHVLDVTDWLYLMENGTIMNRSQMFKYGLQVGELVATIRPVGE